MNLLKTEITEMLLVLFGEQDLADRWWNKENFYFGLKTPTEVFNKNPKAIYRYVAGQFDMQI